MSPTTTTNGSTHPKNPSSLSGSCSSEQSDRKPRRHRSKSQRRPRNSKSVERSGRRRFLDADVDADDRPLHVVVSTSDIPSSLNLPDDDLLEIKAMEEEGIQMVRKALSSLNIGS